MKLFGYDVDKVFKLVRDVFIITSSIETAMKQIDDDSKNVQSFGKSVGDKNEFNPA